MHDYQKKKNEAVLHCTGSVFEVFLFDQCLLIMPVN